MTSFHFHYLRKGRGVRRAVEDDVGVGGLLDGERRRPRSLAALRARRARD